MILVDTSVWVRALAGKQPHRTHLDELLAGERVLGHELVYGELMIGDRGARAKLLANYIHYAYASTISHSEVVNFVRARRLYGRGIGWLDAHLLASTLVSRAKLHTLDSALLDCAKQLGVAYSPRLT